MLPSWLTNNRSDFWQVAEVLFIGFALGIIVAEVTKPKPATPTGAS